MDNSRYRAFAASVETGSFSKAAEKLNYSASGVSQLVNALEDEVGFALLFRSKRGVRPTPNGERILPAIMSLLGEEERLSQIVDGVKGLEIGSITIASYSSIATHWLPRVLKGFQQRYPRIEVHMIEGIRQAVEARLADRTADLAFYSAHEPMPHDWIHIAYDPMIAVLPHGHPLEGADAYPIERCQEENFIMPAMGSDVDVVDLFARNGISPRIVYSTLENFTAMAMIEQGLGMSIMNELITKRIDVDVVKLPLDPPQSISLGMAVPKLSSAPPAVRRFVDFALEELGAPQAR